MTALLGLLPWRWIGVAAAILAAVLAVEWHGRATVQRKWDAERAQMAAERDTAERELRRFEQARSRNIQEALDAQVTRAARARADAAGARGELERLRGALAAAPAAGSGADPRAAGRPGGAATAGELLGTCAGELQSVAGSADALSVQVSGLQSWIKTACVAAPAQGAP